MYRPPTVKYLYRIPINGEYAWSLLDRDAASVINGARQATPAEINDLISNCYDCIYRSAECRHGEDRADGR
jgi:hypothetical protein